MSTRNKSRPQSSVKRSLRNNVCKRVASRVPSASEGLDLTAINDSRDPELKAYFRAVVKNEFEAMTSCPSRSQFGQAMERASLRVAHKFAHLLPSEQQALLARTPMPSCTGFSSTAA